MSAPEFQDFLVEYQFNGKRWGLLIKAENWADAEARLKALGSWGRVVGSDVVTVPVHLGFLAKLLVWWRNA